MKTIRKVGEVLRLFTAATPEHGLSDLARATGHSVSGTHDLVDGLARIGLLRRVERGRYRLGPLVATLNRALQDSSALIEAARPQLAGLWRDYGETVHLTVEDHGRLLVLDALEGTQGLRVSREVLGGGIALHDCAPGRLHLAHYSEAQLADYIERQPWPGTKAREGARLRADLEGLAQADFAAGPPGPEPDVICLGAMIRDHVAQPVAVIAMSVPRSRHEVQPRAYRSLVLGAAREISARLGWVAEPG